MMMIAANWAKLLMPLVLTSCTNRKRVAPARDLTAGSIRLGDLRSVADSWQRRLRAATHLVPVGDLYCGRAFRQAERAALQARAGFFVVSAGLGLLPSSIRVPSYSLTIATGSVDSVLSRISGAPRPSHWWGELTRSSPYAASLTDAVGRHKGPILLALSASYLAMIADDLLDLPARTHTRFRLFTLSPPSALPGGLRRFVLPYDSRFDGIDSPIPGTRGDFAQRSLGHFVDAVLSQSSRADFDGHADAVERLLSRLRPQQTPVRIKRTDAEITMLIHRHWGHVRGQSSRMLRYLRDDLGIACEQGRFRNLFLAAKAHRENAG